MAVYNYLPNNQTITIELQNNDWFELLEDINTKRIELNRNDVGVVYFTIKAKEIGKHKLTVFARDLSMRDAISRNIAVEPDGKEIIYTINDRLDKDISKTLYIPENAIDGTSKILVKIYPGIFSQVVEGLENIFRMPYGCFEQTSSTTYPNVLVLNYMRETDQITPELSMKAEGFINIGYQRLLSFEVEGGGFEWFGNSPANKILTAYGLMEFKDMSKVYEIDPDLIPRTQRWILSKQNADGSWSSSEGGLHEMNWRKIKNADLPTTAYITWALVESGSTDSGIDKAISYIKEHLYEAEDPYTLALCANALVSADKNSDSSKLALQKLNDMRVEGNNIVYWESSLNSFYSHGNSASIETTALATYALLKGERYTDTVNKAITFLIKSRDSYGTWYSTQGTVLSMKTLLLSLEKSTSQSKKADISIFINGILANTLHITPDNGDVLQIVDLKQYTEKGNNSVEIKVNGEGNLLYQIVGKYYVPWKV
ncbi:MAG: prenyltransferase/squalene oxidase repeat-containing protein, partial [Methanosarcinales archaeon]